MRRYHFIGTLEEELPFLLVILERMPHFIGYLREEVPFYRVNWEGGWWIFLFMSKTMLRLAGLSFYYPSSTSRAGRLEQVNSLVWPKVLFSR